MTGCQHLCQNDRLADWIPKPCPPACPISFLDWFEKGCTHSYFVTDYRFIYLSLYLPLSFVSLLEVNCLTCFVFFVCFSASEQLGIWHYIVMGSCLTERVVISQPDAWNGLIALESCVIWPFHSFIYNCLWGRCLFFITTTLLATKVNRWILTVSKHLTTSVLHHHIAALTECSTSLFFSFFAWW